MATNYHILLRQIAIRINALNGATPALLETTYGVLPLTAAEFQSSIFPFTAIKDALLLAESRLATAIATKPNEPDRSYITAVTANVATGAVVPTTSAGGFSIIGAYGSVRDASDNKVCTPKTLQEVLRRNRNAGSFYRVPAYHYAFDANRIEHTRTNVKLDVCVWDYATQAAAVANNTAMLLGDELAEAIICGALAALIRDDEWLEQGAVWAGYFTATLARYTS